jgi:hypothetical protein
LAASPESTSSSVNWTIDCSIDRITFQSTSIDRCTIRGGEFNILNGTPRNLRLEDTVIRSISIGTGHGATRSVQAYDSFIANANYALRGLALTNFTSTSGGVLIMNRLTAPNQSAACNGLIPGARGL